MKIKINIFDLGMMLYFGSPMITQINGRSGFLDASNIYGFNAVRGAAVRTFVNGRLRIDEPARPPLNVDGLPMSPVADARKQRLTASASVTPLLLHTSCDGFG